MFINFNLFLLISACFCIAKQQVLFRNSILSSNSVKFCSSSGDVFTPEEWTLSPDPPERGKELQIYVKGKLSKKIERGIAHVQVKLGFIQLLNQEYDLCEYVDRVDKKCPLEAGEIVVQKSLEIPKELPPGRYRIHVDIYIPNSSPITCLEAEFRM